MEKISRLKIILPRIMLLTFGFLIYSCQASPPSTPMDNVATAVAATLTAYPTRTTLPTVTSLPSSTEERPPTATATATPTPGPSPTATVPPLPAGDPRSGLNLAQPDYRDQFDITTTWGGPNNEAARNLIKDGYLEATDLIADSYVWWSTTVPEGRNVYVEVSAKFLSCSGKDSAGLGLRISGDQYDSGYTLEVSCDGYFRVRSFSEGVVATLIDWTPRQEILEGSDVTNVLGFVAKSNSLHVVINRNVVGSTEDFAIASGTFALFSNALETPGFTVQFDDFKLWFY